MNEVRKVGPVLPFATDENGAPICPQDGLSMVSDDDGRSWQCPIGKAQMDAMTEWAIKAFEQIVIKPETPEQFMARSPFGRGSE